MAHQLSIPGDIIPLHSLEPAADAAGRTGVYIDPALYQKVIAVALINQGNAATVQVKLTKADDTSGTNATDVTAGEVLSLATNQDMAAGVAFTRQTAAATFTTSAATKVKAIAWEIDPAALTKRYLAVTTGASNVANITSAMFYGVKRYHFI